LTRDAFFKFSIEDRLPGDVGFCSYGSRFSRAGEV
jgi:hypothetical protein